jgi:hypothetical protein
MTLPKWLSKLSVSFRWNNLDTGRSVSVSLASLKALFNLGTKTLKRQPPPTGEHHEQ